MGAIEILMSEHRNIERGIDALVSFAFAVERGAGEKPELAKFVTFIREYADAAHHHKEEDVLFAAMVEAGFPRQGGPVAVMLHEHDLGRGHVRALAALAEQPAPWSAEDRGRVVAEATGYAELLRAHIEKEDSILYPMAEHRLPPALLARVDQTCAAFDEGERSAGRTARLLALASELWSRHLPGAAGIAGGAPPQP